LGTNECPRCFSPEYFERGTTFAFEDFEELFSIWEEEAGFDGGEDSESCAVEEGVAFEKEDVPYSGTGFQREMVEEEGEDPIWEVVGG